MHQKLFYRSHYLMHSRFELFIPELESGNFILFFDTIVEKIEKLENLISRFIDDSTTSLLNKLASVEPIKVDSYYFDLIDKCINYFHKTKGYFNISAGSFPSQSIGIRLNNQQRTIFFESPDISIDFGGIGKGLAIELAIQIISENNIESALINFGDSSVYAIGAHPQGDYWPVSITKGLNRQTFNLKNNGLSSSGLHVNNGKEIAHIIGPFTGNLINRNEKVVVVSECPVRAEVLSTAIYAAEENMRNEIRKEFIDDEVFVL